MLDCVIRFVNCIVEYRVNREALVGSVEANTPFLAMQWSSNIKAQSLSI